MLYTVPVNESWEFLPSEELKHKVIVKAKSNHLSKLLEMMMSQAQEMKLSCLLIQTYATKDQRQKCEITLALSSLVYICEAVHFHRFEDPAKNKKCHQMSSFSEAKANKLIETKGSEFVKYNTKRLSRIYPAGRRTDSSNFKPIPYWTIGWQLVALNYQHAAKPMLYNDVKFHDTGGCGEVFKPEVLHGNTPYEPESTENDSDNSIDADTRPPTRHHPSTRRSSSSLFNI